MLKRMMILIMALPLALAAVSLPSHGQVNPFKGYGALLSGGDLELMKQAAAKLFEDDEAEVGALQKWENADTGNQGTVTLVEIFEFKDLPCKKLHHRFRIKGESDPKSLNVRRCRTEDGEWKLLS